MPGATPEPSLPEMRAHLDALQTLKESPGWKIVRQRLAALATMYTAKMMESVEPNLLLKLNGQLKEVVELDRWPEKQVEVLREQVRLAEARAVKVAESQNRR